MKFIDLFAGLGGFHLALSRLGHECVFACEKEEHLRTLYQQNFGILPSADIREVHPTKVPKHDILCAGFPCQPFSKAGEQQGFDCPRNGDLFDYVVALVRQHQPSFLIFENVPNLKWHNGGSTFEDLERSVRELGYDVQHERLSPHHFGIPQIRERIFIVASRKQLSGFAWPTRSRTTCSIHSVLAKNPPGARQLSKQVSDCIAVWQEFIESMPADVDFPPCPLWSMEFGATYPYDDETPWSADLETLSRTKGSFGARLIGTAREELLSQLPSHGRTRQKQFPKWKRRFIQQNREFFAKNRKWIEPWLPRIRNFPASLQKLEWNCKGDERDIWKYVLQFRASGVRVKRPTTAPSLVAMTTTQVPIIAWERRYMTPRECAQLQSMGGLKYLPSSDEKAFAALGNAVNVEVVHAVAKALLTGAPPKRQRARSRRPRSPRVVEGAIKMARGTHGKAAKPAGAR